MGNCANDVTEGRRRQSRRGRLSSLATPAATVVAIAAFTSGYCGIVHSIQTAFRERMSHVAIRVAELHEKYPVVSVRGLSFSAHGRSIASDSDHASINIWDWRSHRIERTLDTPKGFVSASSINPIQYSPDGQMLAACEGKGVGDAVVRIWDVRNWSLLKDIVDTGPGLGCRSMVFTPDGKFLIYAVFRIRTDSELVAYTTNSWRVAWRIPLGAMPRIDIEPFGVAMSPDGRLLAVSGTESVVVKSSAAPRFLGQIVRRPVVDIVDLRAMAVVKTYHGSAIGSIAWSPDGSRIAVAGGEYLDIFEARSGRRTSYESGRGTSHTTIIFTQDGRYLIESDINGRGTGLGVSIWDGSGEKLLQRIRGDSGSIALSRDGRFLAVGGVGHSTIWQFK